MSNIVAIIPARADSKSVKDKNIAPLGGHPLIAYSIMVARLSGLIERVLVSTDSEEYRDVALKYGAEVPFLRPAQFSGDKSEDGEFLRHAMDWLKTEENCEPEYWVHLRPTTPLRDPKLMDEAIAQLLIHPEATSLRSAHPTPESPFKWFKKNQDKYFVGLDASGDNEAQSKPKEFFEQVYIPDGYVDVVRRSVVMNQMSVHGDKILGYISPVCSEVDSEQELNYIRWQVNSYPEHLKQALNKMLEEEV